MHKSFSNVLCANLRNKKFPMNKSGLSGRSEVFFTIKFACFGEYLNTRIYEFYSLVLKVLLLLAHFSMLLSRL